LRAGELFMLGFRGTRVPEWLRRFEAAHGLGGVILFDYDVPTRTRGRNVESPAQVAALCAELHALPSQPLVFVDQEGGQVRRLKSELGFAPLPSARAFARLPAEERRALARASFCEMRSLGIDFALAPVIDADTNPDNPNIGAIERSFSVDLAVIRENAELLADVARECGLQLCLKHYPGLGGAVVDSHAELTELDGRFDAEQEALFGELAPSLPGRAVLLSHGLVRSWDADWPVSISAVAIQRLRRSAPELLLVSDDLQMEGLRRCSSLEQACVRGARAGLDLLCIGNNLRYEEDAAETAAAAIERELDAAALAGAIARVAERKRVARR
jgi:beta-N-acetylhexosaminidase